MSGQTPRFDELVEADDPERARLRVTHELLVTAGAPPELPPSLESALKVPGVMARAEYWKRCVPAGRRVEKKLTLSSRISLRS